MRPDGLTIPSRHAREPMGDVLDLDVERRGVEQIEASAGQHTLPGARRSLRGLALHPPSPMTSLERYPIQLERIAL